MPPSTCPHWPGHSVSTTEVDQIPPVLGSGPRSSHTGLAAPDIHPAPNHPALGRLLLCPASVSGLALPIQGEPSVTSPEASLTISRRQGQGYTVNLVPWAPCHLSSVSGQLGPWTPLSLLTALWAEPQGTAWLGPGPSQGWICELSRL